MSMVAAPTDRRFRRAQVRPARRVKANVRAALRVLRLLAVAALVTYGTWRATALITALPILHVTRVNVHGNDRLSTGEILSLVDGLPGRHIIGISLDGWRDRLLASPWVQEATLRRMLPGTVEIEVRERRPMAIGRIDSRLYLVDSAGVVIDEYGPQHADIDLPIVDGLATAARAGRPVVDERRAQLAARLLTALAARPDISARVSQIDVSDWRSAVVILEGDTALLRIGDRDFTSRIQFYIELASSLRDRVADIDYVDLRFDERLYVRPVNAVIHVQR